MYQVYLLSCIFLTIFGVCVNGCLITNCPRGGKRSGKIPLIERNIKPQCISCGPGQIGQCFGPNICCGPFGCLMGTSEALVCQQGLFHERIPCTAGSGSCRKGTGRCAIDNICCSQDACHIDKECGPEERLKPFPDTPAGLDLYNLINYPSETFSDK
ncbi:unnamed protein product [Acanthoscelides obtectus]|uniref:Uncharacterized protein n=1 Tax=Acanthoscelides obtectus TaxID=200917 RepID=A0A9P0Q2E4_ACAOB|nr:unnamed protein product [Acanthoscelides obtectus]CAK1649182.1 hypothetical protein AOBTE_LOCUS16087 [Acanthoscelides obtectus]